MSSATVRAVTRRRLRRPFLLLAAAGAAVLLALAPVHAARAAVAYQLINCNRGDSLQAAINQEVSDINSGAITTYGLVSIRGTCKGNFTVPGIPLPLTLVGVTVHGIKPSLNAEGIGTTLTVTGGADVTVQDMTSITGGAKSGIVVGVDSSVTLINSTVKGNATTGSGGGVENHGALVLKKSAVKNNSASDSGGGIANVEPTYYSQLATLTITSSTITGNNAQGGGGLWNTGLADISGSTIENNTADFRGGGIANGGDKTLTLSSCKVHGNHAEDGGGIANFGSVVATQTQISLNTASSSNPDDGNGGGIFNQGGSLVVTNGGILINHADGDGGGIWNSPLKAFGGGGGPGGQNILVEGSVTLVSTTIQKNVAKGNGGGLHNYATAYLTPLVQPDQAYATFTATGGAIRYNEAGGSGGGIFNATTNPTNAQDPDGLISASVLTIGTSLRFNQAVAQGGAIYNDGREASEWFSGGTIDQNMAGTYGGVVCTNSAAGLGFSGNAAYSNSPTPNLVNLAGATCS